MADALQVDRLLIGWRARKTDPRFDSEHITEATACMARAKAARQEQLKRRVAARGVPTSDGKVLPLKIGSMFGSFLLRGPAFGDPTLSNPVCSSFSEFFSGKSFAACVPHGSLSVPNDMLTTVLWQRPQVVLPRNSVATVQP